MLQQGHDTVGESLAWTWYLLSLHPEVERKLISKSLRWSAIAFRPSPTSPAPLRAHGPAGVAARCIRRSGSSRVTRSTTTRLVAIAFPRDPRSCSVPTSPTGIPTSGKIPEAFDPERFLPARSHDRPRHAYFPFGGGPRLCMGVDMAMMEMMLIMVMVVQRHRIHLDAVPSRGGRMRPRHAPASPRAGDASQTTSRIGRRCLRRGGRPSPASPNFPHDDSPEVSLRSAFARFASYGGS